MRLAVVAAALLASSGLAQVKLPATQSVTLGNGIRLLLAPRKEIPMVTVQAVVRGGDEADPVDKPGVSQLAGELLQRGAGSLEAAAFAARLDALGASLNIATSPQSIAIRMDFLARDSAAALALLADAVARPTFAPVEVDKALKEAIDAARSSKDEPGEAARYYGFAMMFGPGHPYGRLADERLLPRIVRDDIVAAHRRLFVGRNLIVAVAGDFDAAAMRKQVEAALGHVPAGEPFAWPAAKSVNHARSRLLLVDKPDAVQTYFRIMMPGVERGHPDQPVLWLVNSLFGERFTSLLNDALRVNSGLTYGASCRVQYDRLPGAITISSFTKTETTVQAIDLALKVLNEFREKGITQAMLNSARRYVKGTFPSEHLETDAQVAATLAALELFGQNRGEIDNLFSRFDAVTLERANATIRARYTGKNLQFCLVGKASAIGKDVAKYAEAMKTIPIDQPGYGVPEF